MRAVTTALTALLAFVLSASVPAPVEACCLPQAESCCKTSACNCHMSAPSKPAPSSEMPATVVHAPTEALAPVWEGHLFRQNPGASCAAAMIAGAPAGVMRLYSLTHAFLV